MEYGNGNANQLIWKSNENRYHNDEFKVDSDNLNVNVSIVSKYVDAESKVLDVGCGEGKLGRLLRGKDCRLYGVDMDDKAAQYAMKNSGYKQVYVFDMEHDSWTINSDEKYDVVALLDVLEHVVNPTEVLYKCLSYLKNDGKVLISVPNINNGDIILNLLNDHFNYQNAGILDNTHTKYFTKTSFIQWIDEINQNNEWTLDCQYIGGTFGYTDYLEKIKIKNPLVYQFIQENPYFHVIQHMFLLSYKEKKQNTTNLDKLLEDKPLNLVDILERLLQKKSEGIVSKACMLPNERILLEEQLKSAENGWKECSEALEDAKIFQNKLLSDIGLLKKELERCENEKIEIIGKWKECTAAFEELKKIHREQNNLEE